MMFRNVSVLWVLAALPLVLLLLVARERMRTRLARMFVSERLRGVSHPGRGMRPWLLGAGAAMVIVALAGPYAGFALVPIVARESSRVLVIDVSHSMGAEDVGTSRLAAANALAMRLARAQQGRVALVVFEAQPEIVSPLTTDGEAVASLIDTLQPGEVGAPGSDVGSAIVAALSLLETDVAQRGDIVVLSDGEDQGARVDEAVQRAKTRAIPVSTIVVGSGEGASIPTERGPLRDGSGDVVTTYARSEVLRAIAAGTGGLPLENPFGARSLDPLIGRGETTERQTHAQVPIDRYQWPLALAFFALLGGSLLHRGAE